MCTIIDYPLHQMEQESKTRTEDLLGQQFSAKKVDKENVMLLQSLLNGRHTYAIHKLCITYNTIINIYNLLTCGLGMFGIYCTYKQ